MKLRMLLARSVLLLVLAAETFGRYLDSLDLNNTTIDVVILSHQHLDHYSGLRELFRTSRNIQVRYFFENKDPVPAATLAAGNGYGHMHGQAKNVYPRAGVPWYRTDQNGTVTIRSPGYVGGGFTITPERRGAGLNGASDRFARQAGCAVGRRR